MPTHVLHGDSFLVPQALRRLMEETGVTELLDANSHQLQGSRVKPGELFSTCAALPFMDTHRLVVVAGLLATFERRTGERRTGGRSQGRRAAAGQAGSSLGGWEELTRTLPEMPETTVLVFSDGPISESNPLLKLLHPLSRVQSLSAPKGEGLARWIKESAKRKPASISPTAIKLMIDMVGNDLWTLDRELEKLSLYAFGRVIEEQDVEKLVAQVREASIFSAVDAMLEGKPAIALRLLHQLLRDGEEVPRIFGMVERQLRLLALARDAMDRGLPQGEVGKSLGVSHQYVIQKTLEQARRHSWQDITARFHRLLEADLAIKRGIMGPELSLELLVADQARPK